MPGDLGKQIETLSRKLQLSGECRRIFNIGIPEEDLLLTLQRLYKWRMTASMRKWNCYREVINTIRGNSVFLTNFLSVDLSVRKKMLAALHALYLIPDLNYRDRLILLTKFVLAQINPLGNPEMRQLAINMVREFVLHKNREIRKATFRGITFEVARLRLKGGGWYVQPLVDMLVETLRENPETREYIRRESMEIYYTREQRDVVDDILVAVTLSLSPDRKERKH
ncbi:MAG: hypothetical protein GXP58_03160 [Deltaproteobacteria bacterium]|nr:hypothetical protein [Deltaproteobacteria bacterium]